MYVIIFPICELWNGVNSVAGVLVQDGVVDYLLYIPILYGLCSDHRKYFIEMVYCGGLFHVGMVYFLGAAIGSYSDRITMSLFLNTHYVMYGSFDLSQYR